MRAHGRVRVGASNPTGVKRRFCTKSTLTPTLPLSPRNNFYTVTVYEKGAEVVRLYQTLLGVDGFRRGMDEYFRCVPCICATCSLRRLLPTSAHLASHTSLPD